MTAPAHTHVTRMASMHDHVVGASASASVRAVGVLQSSSSVLPHVSNVVHAQPPPRVHTSPPQPIQAIQGTSVRPRASPVSGVSNVPASGVQVLSNVQVHAPSIPHIPRVHTSTTRHAHTRVSEELSPVGVDVGVNVCAQGGNVDVYDADVTHVSESTSADKQHRQAALHHDAQSPQQPVHALHEEQLTDHVVGVEDEGEAAHHIRRMRLGKQPAHQPHTVEHDNMAGPSTETPAQRKARLAESKAHVLRLLNHDFILARMPPEPSYYEYIHVYHMLMQVDSMLAEPLDLSAFGTGGVGREVALWYSECVEKWEQQRDVLLQYLHAYECTPQSVPLHPIGDVCTLLHDCMSWR